jgi:hypothetical protein
MAKLKPPKNYREIHRRCCANCAYWVGDAIADYVCLRAPEDIVGDWHHNEPEFHVCDRHKWRHE